MEKRQIAFVRVSHIIIPFNLGIHIKKNRLLPILEIRNHIFLSWFKLSRHKHGTAITFLIYVRNAAIFRPSVVILGAAHMYTFRYTLVRENLKSRIQESRCFADERKTTDSPAECTADSRDCNSSRRAIWSGPYDECRVRRVCERRGKMRVVSFPGIFHRFCRSTRVRFERVAWFFFFPWKRYPTFRPHGWLTRNSVGCFALISLRDKCNRTKDAGTGRQQNEKIY